jgi:hypothetical protein
MVTTVPPAVVPEERLRLVTDGKDALEYVKWSLLETLEVPFGVTTVTSTVPAACGGATAVNWLSEFTMKLLAGTLPKKTRLTPVKMLPFTVVSVPPAVVPDVVPRLVTEGAAAPT